MSWLQVGKSFQEANATSLTVLDTADSNFDLARSSKRRRRGKHEEDEFDSSSGSDEEAVGPMLEFRAQPKMAKSVFEVTWSVDRKGDKSSLFFSVSRNELDLQEKEYHSDGSVSSERSNKRSKKRRKIQMDRRTHPRPPEESREVFDKRHRYFGKQGRNTLLSVTSHRFHLRPRSHNGVKPVESPTSFLVAPQTEHLVPLLDIKENPDLFQIGVDPKCVHSLQTEILEEVRH